MCLIRVYIMLFVSCFIVTSLSSLTQIDCCTLMSISSSVITIRVTSFRVMDSDLYFVSVMFCFDTPDCTVVLTCRLGGYHRWGSWRTPFVIFGCWYMMCVTSLPKPRWPMIRLGSYRFWQTWSPNVWIGVRVLPLVWRCVWTYVRVPSHCSLGN